MNYQIRTRANKAGAQRFSVSLEVWLNGNRKVVPGGTFGSQREAERAGERLLIKFENDSEKLKALQGNRTLTEWSEEWIAGLTNGKSTITSYRWRMQHWVLPYLGQVQLKDLTAPMIDRWINGIELAHLAKNSKQSYLDVLRTSLAKAVKDNVLPSNPAEKTNLGYTRAQMKAEKTMKKIKAWSYSEVELLLDAAVGLAIEPVVVLGLLAGLRPGESMAVRWSDIDWAEGTVRVTRTLSRDEKYRPIISHTTKNGETRFPRLTSDAKFRLMAMKERLEAQGPLDPDAPLYSNRSGCWKQFLALQHKAGVKILTPHCLRHTHASLLLENGATLAAVAKQLGHSNPTITAAIYWHLLDDTTDTISGVMDQALRKPVAEPDPSDASRATTATLEPVKGHTDE